MAAKQVKNMTLDELYERVEETGKTTPSVSNAIISKEDFSKYQNRYCDLVCKFPCSKDNKIPLQHESTDVLIIQSHVPFKEKWKRGAEIEYTHRRQFEGLISNSVSMNLINMTKCPPDHYRKKGKTVSKLIATDMKSCIPYMLEEIRRINPKVIVSTTTEVTKALGFKDLSNTNNRGEVHIMEELGIPVVITLHVRLLNMIRQNSSGAFWGDEYTSVVINDLSKASSIALGKLSIPDLRESVNNARENQIAVCESIDDVRYWTDVLLALPKNAITSWDLETTSLDPWSEDARVLTSQVGFRRRDGKVQAVVFPLWHKDNIFYDADEAFEIHKEYLLRDSTKVGHNITFDICFMAVTTGVRLAGEILCTMLALHSINSGIKGCYGLKSAVWDYLPESGLGGYETLLEVDHEAVNPVR